MSAADDAPPLIEEDGEEICSECRWPPTDCTCFPDGCGVCRVDDLNDCECECECWECGGSTKNPKRGPHDDETGDKIWDD